MIFDVTPQTNPDFEWVIANDLNIVQRTLDIASRTPLYAGGARGTSTTHSAQSFYSWFNGVPGVNIGIPVNITLSNANSQNKRIYVYDNSNFFPIDGMGFGNYGTRCGGVQHNYHFCYQFHSHFGYQGGETFTFRGDDDCFVFIDNRLQCNLGGVHGPQSCSFSLDNIQNPPLVRGHSYRFDYFGCERHTCGSNVHIESMLDVQCGYIDRCGICEGTGQSCCTCNDNNKCTYDTCDIFNSSCYFSPVVCDDGNACTIDQCNPDNGQCLYTPVNVAVACNDGNACTVDGCDPNAGSAVGSIGCTHRPVVCTADRCHSSTCVNGTCVTTDTSSRCIGADPCVDYGCIAGAGCTSQPKVCNDNNRCTTDSCVGGTCQFLPITCDDHDWCTIDDCSPQSGCTFTSKMSAGVCDDDNVCTLDSCSNATQSCVHQDISASKCNDGNLCTVDTCNQLSGCMYANVTCNDYQHCFVGSCNPGNGQCVYQNVSDQQCPVAPCETGGCNVDVGCKTQPVTCATDACHPSTCQASDGLCHNTTLTACLCNTTVVCTTTDVCQPNTCDPNVGECRLSNLTCNDNNLCTLDTCAHGTGPGTGCQFPPKPCDQSDLCSPQFCDPADGVCKPKAKVCDDYNACTVNSCNSTTGDCIFTNVPCTWPDLCSPQTCNARTGACEFLGNVTCNDGNLCTIDTCNSTAGQCGFVPVMCPTSDACFPRSCDHSSGLCVNSTVVCNDGNNCTTDYCLGGTCYFDAVVCSSGDPCLVASCDAGSGSCLTAPVDCNDGNVCTIDTCNGTNGTAVCEHTLNLCDDNNTCTEDTCCSGSSCAVVGCSNTPVLCNVGNACLEKTCDPFAGCSTQAIACPSGSLCETLTCEPTQGCLSYPKTCPVDGDCQESECSPSTGQCVTSTRTDGICAFASLSASEKAGVLSGGIIAAITIAVVVAVLAATGGSVGYVYYKRQRGTMGAALANPLYEESKHMGTNPLYDS